MTYKSLLAYCGSNPHLGLCPNSPAKLLLRAPFEQLENGGLKPGAQNVPSQKAEQQWTQVSQLILMFSPTHPRRFSSYTETWTCNKAQSPRHKERQKKKNRARKLSRGMLQHWSTKSSVPFPRIQQVLAQTRQALSSTQYMVYSHCILEGIYHGILFIKCIEQCHKWFLHQLPRDDFLPSF